MKQICEVSVLLGENPREEQGEGGFFKKSNVGIWLIMNSFKKERIISPNITQKTLSVIHAIE